MMDAGFQAAQINAAEEVLDLTRIQDVAGVRAGCTCLNLPVGGVRQFAVWRSDSCRG